MSNPYAVWNAPRPDNRRLRSILPSQIEAIEGRRPLPAYNYKDVTAEISLTKFTDEARRVAAERNYNIYALHPDVPFGTQSFSQLRRDITQAAPRYSIHDKFPNQYYTVSRGNTRGTPDKSYFLD